VQRYACEGNKASRRHPSAAVSTPLPPSAKAIVSQFKSAAKEIASFEIKSSAGNQNHLINLAGNLIFKAHFQITM